MTQECGKQTYTSQAAAKQVAKRIRWQRSSVINEYYCKPCNGWHVGGSREDIQQKKELRTR